MKEELFDELFDDKEEKTDYLELFLKYLSHWPLFVISILLCLVVAVVYVRYTPPVYEVTSSILIKEDEKKSNQLLQNAMQDFGVLSMTSNFHNEVEKLRSRTLVKNVVTTLGLYINLSEERPWGYAQPLYHDSPLQVNMTAEEAARLESALVMKLCYRPSGALSVEGSYTLEEKEYRFAEEFDSLPAILPLPVGVVSITSRDSINSLSRPVRLKAHITTPTAATASYIRALTIEAISKQSTVASISLKNSHIQRAVDFTNTLVDLYNQDANTEKNEVARKSADFIEERIRIINSELGTTESELANFKQRSGLTNLSSDAQLALQENSRYEQLYTETTNQINLVTYLRDYINDPANNEEVIPANVGLSDISLSSVIERYNTLILERKRLLRVGSESNPAVVNLTAGIDAMRRNVQTTVHSVLQGLQITLNDIERQTRKYETRISNAPKQELEFVTISRQQEIKATLYIMLLQKREENAITLAATANNGRLIEEPMATKGPVSPKKKIIFVAAFLLGLAIPMSIIYLRDLLRFRIGGRADVEKLTDVPIVGDIPLHTEKRKDDDVFPDVVVREGENSMMAEVFRSVRTNVLFMLAGPMQKTILVTSTASGEGKSFISSNLAVSLALLDKKVILLGLDIRKPGLNKVFNCSAKVGGITEYLADPQGTDIRTLIQPSGVTPNLDLLFCGPTPPNPAELLSRSALDDLMAQLKSEYDYVVLDSAPIGMVTDTQIIARVADVSLYVCRADYTNKEDYKLINELQERKLLPNLCTVINAIDMSKQKYGYYYGYGKYGYGKKYGYGYKQKSS